MKKLLSAILAAMLLLTTALPAFAQDVPFEATIEWDAEYDVVVAGFGGAGAVSAITAADEGAKVLLLEKGPEGEAGGNTRYAAQILLTPTDREKAITYFKAMRGGYNYQSDDVIELIVDGAMAIPEWLVAMGADKENLLQFPLIEYPDLPGADGISTTIIDKEFWTSKFWGLLFSNVSERAENIDVWYSAPAVRLIQDPATRIIHGVKVEQNGQTLNVRAKNGVVMAVGGFENNEEMIEHYTQREHLEPIGTLYNTGDGIRMAIEVGADLWHMAALSGPWITLYNDESVNNQAWFNQPSMGMNLAKNGASIYVGQDGTRFAPESGMHRHGHINYSGNFYSQITPDPMWMIFDETARLAGPIMPSFSEDMSAEIESGLIVKADTIAELAEKIGVQVDGPLPDLTQMTDGVTAGESVAYRRAGLVYQVELYNRYCEDGYDEQFDRNPATLAPIATAPYYAIKLVPALVNTQGGPKRNTNCEILDTQGNTIPHLYGAGELGSMYGGYYTAGGNVAETLFSGRTAGANAAKAKDAVPTIELTAVASDIREFGSDLDKQATYDLAEGETIGVGAGMGGELVVKVTRADGVITKVEVLSHGETPAISDPALEQIPQAIVEANAAAVDAVAGATVTSNAIMQAVAAAIAE